MLGTFLLSVFFIAANSWTGASATDDYHEAFTYDANGNILTLIRNGLAAQALAMDTFSYRYTPNTNRLDHVKDAVNAANYNIDIDNQDTLNYRYDAIGNLTKDVSEGIDTILWTVYGKVAAVSKADSNLLIRFAYNPMGQRVEKEVIRNADTTKTLYVHDASGNIMAIYTLRNGDSLKLNDVPIYGSSRLGVWNANKLLRIDSVLHDTEIQAQDPQDPATVGVSYHSAGEKQYELSNHLGNVLATASDRKIPYYVSGALDHYKAEQLTGNDYYSFGMLMPDRSFSTGYRFGFNGMEKDDEVKGAGNSLDFGARIYDSRLGRWQACDPKSSKYPSHSPFHYGYNNPVITNDPNGEENIVVVGGADVAGNQRAKFMNTGLKKLSEYNRKQPKEQTTLVVMTAFLSDKDKNTLMQKVHKMQDKGAKVDIVFAENADQLTNYLNYKTTQPNEALFIVDPQTSKPEGINNRMSDKVTDVAVFGHGYARTTDLGPSFEPGHGAKPGNVPSGENPTTYHDKFTWDIQDALLLNPQAFDNPVWDFQTCNAATECISGSNVGHSLAGAVSQQTNGTASGWFGKSDYYGVTNDNIIPEVLKSEIREADNYPKAGKKDDRSGASERVTYTKGVKK